MATGLLDELAGFGLNQSESKVYLTALELGGSYVSLIAKRAGIERSNCYHTLKTLSEKGLISMTKKGSVRYYLPEAPSKLLADAQQQLHIAERIVPALLSLQNTARGRVPKIRYYDDLESIRRLLVASADCSSEILRYTNVKQLQDKFPDVLEGYAKKLASRGKHLRIVSSYHKESETFLERYFPTEYYRTHIKLLFVNPREFLLENEITIYDDKVSIVSLSKDEHLGIAIESKVFADTSRTVFNLASLGASHFEVR